MDFLGRCLVWERDKIRVNPLVQRVDFLVCLRLADRKLIFRAPNSSFNLCG